jgi:mercuric ion binding protein
MKNLFFLLLVCTLHTSNMSAQDKKDITTATIQVSGVCGSCKKRIENAAYIPGVRHAEWNKETGILTVSFKPTKVSKEKIAQAVAEKGHTADEQAANQKAYENLPKCCAYNDGVHKH